MKTTPEPVPIKPYAIIYTVRGKKYIHRFRNAKDIKIDNFKLIITNKEKFRYSKDDGILN